MNAEDSCSQTAMQDWPSHPGLSSPVPTFPFTQADASFLLILTLLLLPRRQPRTQCLQSGCRLLIGREIWNWQIICDYQDHLGISGNGWWSRWRCSYSTKCEYSDIIKIGYKGHITTRMISWRPQQRQGNRWYPRLGPRIPESWAGNTLWTYSSSWIFSLRCWASRFFFLWYLSLFF